MLAVEDGFARNIAEHLPGEVFRYDGDLVDVPHAAQEIEGPRRLVEYLVASEATVAVIGVQLGGQKYLAMDAVRALLGSDGPPSPPAVVLVCRHSTPMFLAHAWEIGAFSIVETDRPDRGTLSRVTADEALLAHAWRDGRGERRPFSPLPRAPSRPLPVVARTRRRPSRRAP